MLRVVLWQDWFMFNSFLRHRNQSRKRKFIGVLALCIATSSACSAKPREVGIVDEYDGLAYHFSEKIAQAITRDKKSNLFRIMISDRGPSGWGYTSALYNRKQRTLKIYDFSNWLTPDDSNPKNPEPALARRSQTTTEWLYRNVNDAKLRRLAAMQNESYIFGDGDIDGRDKDLIKLKIKSRQLYKRTTYWDVQPNGKMTRARWTFDSWNITYRYPKRGVRKRPNSRAHK